MPRKRILITGSCGFISTSLIPFLKEQKDVEFILGIDKISPQSNLLQNLEFQDEKYHFVNCNTLNDKFLYYLLEKNNINCVIDMASESHVDRSIENPDDFIHSNILGCYSVLKTCKKWIETSKIQFRYLYLNTDECFGALNETDKSWTEDSPYLPNSPYSASKSSAGLLIRSFVKTYKFPAMVIHACNNYGPAQASEKLISKTILSALNNKEIIIYDAGLQCREWLYVKDMARAIYFLLNHGSDFEVYNVGSGIEKRNIEIVDLICSYIELEKGRSCSNLKSFIPNARLSHDFKYSLCCDKIRSLGWRPIFDFEKSLYETIEWYCNYDKFSK